MADSGASFAEQDNAPLDVDGVRAPSAETSPVARQQRRIGEELSVRTRLGRIVSVSGSHILLSLDDKDAHGRHEIGSLVRINTADAAVFGQVTAMSVPAPGGEDGIEEIRIVEVELVGELVRTRDGVARFRKGVGRYPTLGDVAYVAAREDLAVVYPAGAPDVIRLGALKQDPEIIATARVNELLGRHFAVLGTTGSGKSCAVALILRSILQRHQNAHIVVLDPHGEYRSSFGARAEVVNNRNLHLPYWLFNFEEIIEVLYPGRRMDRDEVDILAELIPAAKRQYASSNVIGDAMPRLAHDAQLYGMDTPVPYRMSDIIAAIDRALGKLDQTDGRGPFKRLRARLVSLTQDTRYSFMFGGLTVQDSMADVISRLLRIPVDGKPVTILDLAGLPAEVVNVVVSVLARMIFDFGMWSDGAVPVTLVCEEAHRYAPVDERLGFLPTRRALARIAKEGRKYGVSLCVVSQRPMELDPTILSQCNTIFAMRLANREDRETLRAAVPEASTGLMDCLPSLGLGESVAVGEGVPMPTRLRFDALPRDAVPRGNTASFVSAWSKDVEDPRFVEGVVARWRVQQH